MYLIYSFTAQINFRLIFPGKRLLMKFLHTVTFLLQNNLQITSFYLTRKKYFYKPDTNVEIIPFYTSLYKFSPSATLFLPKTISYIIFLSFYINIKIQNHTGCGHFNLVHNKKKYNTEKQMLIQRLFALVY